MAAGATGRLWSVEDSVAPWEAYERRRAERAAWVRYLFEFILRFLAAILAVGVCVVLGVFFSWLLGVFLFHKGVIGDATLFGFPLYGVLPGLIVGGVCYAVILCWQAGFKSPQAGGGILRVSCCTFDIVRTVRRRNRIWSCGELSGSLKPFRRRII
jgi:hypothetical protein